MGQIASFSAGFGDAFLLGAGPTLRQWLDADGSVDMESGSYTAGEIAGTVVATVITEGAAAEGEGATAASKASKVKEGVYEVVEGDKTYVGQAGDIDRRLAEHVGSGKITAEAAANAKRTEVLGGKTAREVAEQKAINAKGGIKGGKVTNQRNPIGKARKHLLDQK